MNGETVGSLIISSSSGRRRRRRQGRVLIINSALVLIILTLVLLIPLDASRVLAVEDERSEADDSSSSNNNNIISASKMRNHLTVSTSPSPTEMNGDTEYDKNGESTATTSGTTTDPVPFGGFSESARRIPTGPNPLHHH